MEDKAGPATSPPQLTLPPILGAEAAAELKRSLLDAAGAEGCVNVDAGAVQRTGTLCLQVLCAAATALRANGARLRLHSVPEAMSETIGLLGLRDSLGMGEP